MSLTGTDALRSQAQVAAKSSLLSYADSKRIAQYAELTKPGITVFVGVSAATGYTVAAVDTASWVTVAAVMTCTMLMSGGAAVQNHVRERARDRQMRRTSNRPVAAGHVRTQDATRFGWALSTLGLALSLVVLPPMTAVFLVLCHISYVNVYTPMKTRSPACTLVGAFPGALPVLAGAAASIDGVNLPALLLTVLLFTWQMPHFMAIGWLAREDYARGEYAMLFLTEATGRQTAAVAVMYAAAMVGAALLLGIASSASLWFMGIAAIGSFAYLALSIRFTRERSREHARRLFFASLLVLPVTLITLVADLLLR